ncbi:PREDICTED: integrator complex subunit 11 [Diuraphis noxia]|uniref:integrator complex subunit 11 n=1 Tax=Diuraphis noxia TaxID=143948 RepID=UPI000763B53E|nr:PREDICTED: integrator complex subunit 11 [Diuraphis noxia]
MNISNRIIVTPLGAGQDVGRSCILITIGNRNIMLDCGMHMGYQDERKFPDFSYITSDGNITDLIDCVIISHFHLDHCGALSYLTEHLGYHGPIYMTHPTKAIAPILLEDMRKHLVEYEEEAKYFTSSAIRDCMKKVTAVNLHEVVTVKDDIELKAYYAGHVLGAAMFYIKVGNDSVVYTGDFSMTPDRHLGAAWIDKCRPTLLITESTYATTIRDSKRCRERDFLKNVHECIDRGGKVLIPIFALGRAQELCILIDTYWDRMGLKVPVYFAAGLTEKANSYYKMFITWTNQKVRQTFVQRNMFDFKHIKPFDKTYMHNPGPMVVFATPGMLHAGLSLNIFKKWAPDEKNMLIVPGYCVSGTVGNKVLSGSKKIEAEPNKFIDVKMSVEYLSFSAHADGKGIIQLIKNCEPQNVLLVHGEEEKMKFLRAKIMQEFNINCYMPANGETVEIETANIHTFNMSTKLVKEILDDQSNNLGNGKRLVHGAFLLKNGSSNLNAMSVKDTFKELDIQRHTLRFTCTVEIKESSTIQKTKTKLYDMLENNLPIFKNKLTMSDGSISLASILVTVEDGMDNNKKKIVISWANEDEPLGNHVLEMLQNLSKSD